MKTLTRFSTHTGNSQTKKLLAKGVIFACALQAALLAPASASAATEKQQSIEKLISLTGAEMMITNTAKQQSIAIIEEQIADILKKNNAKKALTNKQRQAIMTVAHNNAQSLFQGISTPETQGQVFGIYAQLMDKAYTKEEIDAQLAFFASPAGQSIQVKQPQVMQAFSVNAFPVIFNQAKPVLDKKIKAQLERDIKKALK